MSSTHFPGKFFLTPDAAAIEAYLASMEWLAPHEGVESAARAGEGNMNGVLRVITSQRTFILKQARPWVEKYPTVAAPWDRALIEARFYQTVQSRETVSSFLPKLLGFDAAERLLMLEDLAGAEDFTFAYSKNAPLLPHAELHRLLDFLIELHTAFRDPALAPVFSNRDMRILNHEHIFALPLRPGNGLDLDAITPGLSAPALRLQADSQYCRAVRQLGKIYLDPSRAAGLLHGDYFPGSWLRARQTVFVIDPEFCFYGPPEWDLGVMTAHLYLAGQSRDLVETLLSRYSDRAPADRVLTFRFAGVEIMRRLIGVAQLPVDFGLARKAELLQQSQTMVLEGRPA